MPIIKSAIKRMRQNTVRRDRRKPIKTLMKTMMKQMREANKVDSVMLAKTYKAIDMAAKHNIIHKKNAARKKSAMSKLVTAK